MFTRTTALVRAAAIAGLLGEASLGTAGLANAEVPLTQDDRNFIDGLQAEDIGFDKPATAIRVANAICSDIASGENYETLVDRGVSESGLTNHQFKYFVEQSVLLICPEHNSYVPR